MPYCPMMNGTIEATNKNLKKIIKKITDTYKDWREKLTFALHAYRTVVWTSTRATPFSLVYGMEVILLIEVEILSLRVLMETKSEEAEWVRAKHELLNLIEKKAVISLVPWLVVPKRMMQAYNKKVRPKQFKKGDLVLKRISSNQQDPKGKWALNW